MVETWPYWLELGIAAAILISGTVLSYGSADKNRKWKFIAFLCVYSITFSVAGFLAFGLTYYTRSDGAHVQWGRWAMFVATHGGAVLIAAMSMSYEKVDWALAFTFGTGSALFLLFGELTPARDCGNSYGASILSIVLSGVCVAAVFLLMLGLALGWRRLLLFPLDYASTDGRSNVINRWWLVLAALGVASGLSVYTILYSLGPEGIPTSCKAGHSNSPVYTSEKEQIWLTMALADGFFLGIVIPLIYYFLNPDGQPTNSMYAIVAPAEPVDLETPLEPVSGMVGNPVMVDGAVRM